MAVSQEKNKVITGGMDGMIYIRNMNNITEITNKIKAHNLK